MGATYLNNCIDGEVLRILRLLSKHEENEICGFILGDNSYSIIFPVENKAENPSTEFYMNPHGILAAHRLAENLGLEVKAIYHTHPKGSPEPSGKDLEGMKLWPMPWLIIGRHSYKMVSPSNHEGC